MNNTHVYNERKSSEILFYFVLTLLTFRDRFNDHLENHKDRKEDVLSLGKENIVKVMNLILKENKPNFPEVSH